MRQTNLRGRLFQLVQWEIKRGAGQGLNNGGWCGAFYLIDHRTMNATVKRKFNALLQGIGTNNGTASSSSTGNTKRPSSAAALDDEADDTNSPPINKVPSASSPPSSRMASESTEFLNKKRRVGASQPIRVGASTPTKYGTSPLQTTPLRGTTTISNITLRKWTPGGTPGAEGGRDGQPPKYCPGDREQLVRRLATFQELTEWAPKPDPVNEVEWAKRGWVCHGKERVKCTLCSKEVVVKINRKEVDGKEIAVMIASEIAQSVIDMYKDMIITSHAEDCLWRRRGCDGKCLNKLSHKASKGSIVANASHPLRFSASITTTEFKTSSRDPASTI